jgi:hypothetical protein
MVSNIKIRMTLEIRIISRTAAIIKTSSKMVTWAKIGRSTITMTDTDTLQSRSHVAGRRFNGIEVDETSGPASINAGPYSSRAGRLGRFENRMDGCPKPIQPWIAHAAWIEELRHGVSAQHSLRLSPTSNPIIPQPLPDPDIVGTQGRYLVTLPNSPVYHVPVDFDEMLHRKLDAALFLQGLRVRQYGSSIAEEWPNHLTPPGIREEYFRKRDAEAKRMLSMSSSSDDGSDCESPGRTPPSSKEDVTPDGTVTALDKKAILHNTLPLKDPEHTLRDQIRRGRKPEGKTSVGAGRDGDRFNRVRIKSDRVRLRKRLHPEMDDEVTAVNNSTAAECRRSSRLKSMDGQVPCISANMTTKRFLHAPIIQEDKRRRSARLQAKAVGLRQESAVLLQMQPNKRRRRKSAIPNGSF